MTDVHTPGLQRLLTDATLRMMTLEALYRLSYMCEVEPADATICDACAAFLIAHEKEGAEKAEIRAQEYPAPSWPLENQQPGESRANWLFVPGDKVLVLLDEVIYSGVVQQIQMPSPMGAQFPDHIVRVLFDDGSEFAGTAPWCNPDQVERIGA